MTTKKGIVTSAKMQGTITVTIHQLVNHPVYKKRYRSSKKFLVDLADHKDVAVGDEVVIQECRPLSKNKHFLLKEVLKRVPRVSEIADDARTEAAMHRKQKKEEVTSSSDK